MTEISCLVKYSSESFCDFIWFVILSFLTVYLKVEWIWIYLVCFLCSNWKPTEIWDVIGKVEKVFSDLRKPSTLKQSPVLLYFLGTPIDLCRFLGNSWKTPPKKKQTFSLHLQEGWNWSHLPSSNTKPISCKYQISCFAWRKPIQNLKLPSKKGKRNIKIDKKKFLFSSIEIIKTSHPHQQKPS